MAMKDTYILGIESSCDETSVSIVKNGTEEIATIISSQIEIHKDYGGVVPEIASREHVKNVTIVLEECLEKADMIIPGKLEKFYSENVLAKQPFVRDDSKTIEQLVQNLGAKIGEKIVIRRFERFQVGEGIEKKQEDFAAEVAAAMQ